MCDGKKESENRLRVRVWQQQEEDERNAVAAAADAIVVALRGRRRVLRVDDIMGLLIHKVSIDWLLQTGSWN